ncbi:hypothetical protein PAPYR_2819 [Paratrimastix pyriformis]|uniref:Cullin N-terminal domain-containing protein n=1 Tax=Paratrimastix pyriformis TaxID=342808 RepID=A0ABQ8USA0_9EUKA|nr:hypothetical protein PAPYR_2819 [Paratrimastix pyriformis]
MESTMDLDGHETGCNTLSPHEQVWQNVVRCFRMAAAAADQDANSLLSLAEISRLQGVVFSSCNGGKEMWFYDHYRELLITHCQDILAVQVDNTTLDSLLDQVHRFWTRYGRLVKRFNLILSYVNRHIEMHRDSSRYSSSHPDISTLAELAQGCFRTHVLEPRKDLLLAAVQGISAELDLTDRASVLRILEGRYGRAFGEELTLSLYSPPKSRRTA